MVYFSLSWNRGFWIVKASLEWLKRARHYAFGRRRKEAKGNEEETEERKIGRRRRNGEREEGETGGEGDGGQRAQSRVWSPVSPRRTPPSTLKGLHLDQLAHDARTVVPPDPDDQSVWRAACDFIEKLQSLLLPLWVKNPRLQHGRLLRCPEAGVQVHEVAGACGQRTPKSHLCPSTPQASLSPGKATTVSPGHYPGNKGRNSTEEIGRWLVSKYSVSIDRIAGRSQSAHCLFFITFVPKVGTCTPLT